MRDDAVQAQGLFPQARGAVLQHDKLIDFIHRNYEPDARGRWFFQRTAAGVRGTGGHTPRVRIEGSEEDGGESGFSIVAHTGLRSAVQECLLDEAGRLYLFDGRVLGLVHTLDMELAARAVEQALWTPVDVRADELPRRYGYVQRPSELRD